MMYRVTLDVEVEADSEDDAMARAIDGGEFSIDAQDE